MRSVIHSVRNTVHILTSLQQDMDLTSIPESTRKDIHISLQEYIVCLGKYAQCARKIKEKKEYALKKFLECSGPDWRNGQFVYVISSIKAFIYDIDGFLIKYEALLDDMRLDMAAILGKHEFEFYICGKEVAVDGLLNYHALGNCHEEDDTRYIKQRTPRWHEIRETAKVTGSTLYKACGLDTLKRQQEHFDQVVCGIKGRDVSPQTKENIQYGTDNEINAITTLVTKILPSLYPNCHYHEEGCFVFKQNDATFLVVSPDGSIQQHVSDSSKKEVMGVEFKCPISKLHDSVPKRYVLQCLSEMAALDVQKLLYICWRPDVTSVFEMEYNDELFSKSVEAVKDTFCGGNILRPSKTNPSVPELKKELKRESISAKFIGEFRSARNSSVAVQVQKGYQDVKQLQIILNSIEDLIKTGHELQRERASEAVVFLCCDLDRNFEKDSLRWAPICWFTKGYSLTTDMMRKIAEQVRDECYSGGIHIPCSSFDGQWHNISVRDVSGRPLTIFQLQKDVWCEAKRAQKSAIVRLFSSLNKNPTWYRESTQSDDIIVATNRGIHLPKRQRGHAYGIGNANRSEVEELQNDAVSLVDIVPNSLAAVICPESSDLAILQNTQYDASTANELLSSAVSNPNRTEIEDCIQPESDSEGDENGMSLTEEDILLALFEENLQENQNFEQTLKETFSITETSSITEVDKTDCTQILLSLRSDSNANRNKIWDGRNPDFIMTKLQSRSGLDSLRDLDIRVILKYMKTKRYPKLKLSGTKREKVDQLCKILNISEEAQEETQMRKKPVRSIKRLSEMAAKVLSGKSVSKLDLNMAYAGYIWNDRLRNWKRDSRVDDSVKVDDMDYLEFWFYSPEYSMKQQQMEISCIDSSHLLTRTRRKVCKGGIEGFRNKPWIEVAKSKKTHLTPIMIEDIVDPMSVPIAVTHFSPQVENVMKEKGYYEEASLCHDIRCWWSAEDCPGISAVERIKMRQPLRYRLLEYVDFSQFLPPTGNVCGWPIQLWEALLANIDAKCLLYSLSKTGTYNTRSFSSMMGETFFSEVTNQDKHGGHGTVTADEFAQHMSHVEEQMNFRLDKSRTFTYRTSKSTVYKLVDHDRDNSEKELENIADPHNDWKADRITRIDPRNHFFDTTTRDTKKKEKFATVSLQRNALQKGTLGVRWEKARRNESKILPTKRMGIHDEV